MEKEKVNYNILINQLTLLAEEFNACNIFLEDIKLIKCKISFKRFLQREMENICDKLSIDGFDGNLEDEIDDLKDQVDDLQRDNENLQEELDDLKYKYGLNGNTLYDDFKCESFCKYKNNYEPYELEELLKNGKYILNELTV